MYTAEEAYGLVSNLYWIAFLLTARSELSLSVLLEVLDSEDLSEFMSSPQTLAHVRKRVVARALAAIREEVTASAQQTAARLLNRTVLPVANWPIGPHISRDQLEEALLAIEDFPRCALLLTVFEGISVDEAAELLHRDGEMILCGRETGLWELTCNLGSIASAIPLALVGSGDSARLD